MVASTFPLLAYFGPETTLPLMSFLAVILGFLLMCWNYVKRTVVWAVSAMFRRKGPAAPADGSVAVGSTDAQSR